MNVFGGPEAWLYLRCDRHYRAAWRDNAAPPVSAPEYEDTPFPVRIRCRADLAAEEDWRMLAWQDPFDGGGAASPFWALAPMMEGVGSAQAAPLLPLLAGAGATLSGLRLGDGALVLKAEKDGAAVQVLVTGDGPLMAGGGVRLFHDWGLRLPVDVERMEDLWGVSGGVLPNERREGWVRGALTRTCC